MKTTARLPLDRSFAPTQAIFCTLRPDSDDPAPGDSDAAAILRTAQTDWPAVLTSAPDPRAAGGTLRLGRRMILLSALSQNAASGLMFGSFGTLVVEIERRMQVDRGLSTAGASLVILAIGLIAPFIGALLRRFGIKRILIAGAALCGSGYLAAAFAANIYTLLASYALLVGPGIALLGIAVPTSLVANWFVTGRGRAIGLVNMPVAVATVPPIMAFVVPAFGLTGSYLLLAILSFLLIPALLLVIDHPGQVGLRAHGDDTEQPVGELVPQAAPRVVRTIDYWCIGLAASMLAGGGASLVTHLMPMAIGEGIRPELAAVLLSVLGGSGIIGSVLYGSLADRLGGSRALGLNAAIQAVLWIGMLMPMDFLPRLLLTAAIGVNAGGMISSLGTALSQRFGAAALGGAMGFWSLMNLPFSVGMPPLAGILYALYGGYTVAFSVQIGLFVTAALLAAVAARRATRRRLSLSAGDQLSMGVTR